MKVIIAGSRNIQNYKLVSKAIANSGLEITEVVCGEAAGVDSTGAYWANQRKIPVKYFPADWKTWGRGAGYIRNQQMAEYADALILVWDGESPGSTSMKRLAEEYGLPISEVIFKCE